MFDVSNDDKTLTGSDSINYLIEVFLRKKKHYISNGMEKMLTTE